MLSPCELGPHVGELNLQWNALPCWQPLDLCLQLLQPAEDRGHLLTPFRYQVCTLPCFG